MRNTLRLLVGVLSLDLVRHILHRANQAAGHFFVIHLSRRQRVHMADLTVRPRHAVADLLALSRACHGLQHLQETRQILRQNAAPNMVQGWNKAARFKAVDAKFLIRP